MPPQDPEQDPAVVQRVAAGDVEAFAILVKRYAGPLSSYLSHRVEDKHTADDLSQDVFLRAFRSLSAGNFAGASSLKTWLFTIANNTLIDHYRHRARRPKLTDHSTTNDTSDTSSDPARLTERADQAAYARRLIADLPDEQQQVVTMKLFGQLSFAEIATARSRMRYGLLKIHETLATESQPEAIS